MIHKVSVKYNHKSGFHASEVPYQRKGGNTEIFMHGVYYMDIETIDKIKSSKSSKSKIHEAGKMFHIPLNMSECVGAFV